MSLNPDRGTIVGVCSPTKQHCDINLVLMIFYSKFQLKQYNKNMKNLYIVSIDNR